MLPRTALRPAALGALALALAIGIALVVRRDRSAPAPPGAPPAATTTTPPPLAANPVLPSDFPDPAVVRTGSGYLAFATNSGTAHVPVARSRDLRTWTLGADALPTLPSWASDTGEKVWAPSVARVRHGGLLAVALSDRATGRQCIGIGRSSALAGPYVVSNTGPVVCQSALGGAIDPYIFRYEGRRWLLWKNDGNAIGAPSSLWSARLADDLTIGKPNQLLTASEPWETRTATGRPSDATIENPALFVHDHVLYLVYSGNAWDTANYAMGWATCASPAGPCTRGSTSPFLASTAGVVAGPGGGMTFTDGDGNVWLAYHGWNPQAVGYASGGVRGFRLDRMQFSDRAPVVVPH